MSTQNQLPGIVFMGSSYDVTGKFADAHSVVETAPPLFTFDFDSFQPDTDPNTKEINLFQKDYAYPSTLQVSPLLGSSIETLSQETISAEATSMGLGLEVAGTKGPFRGSFKADFEANFSTSSLFYSVTQMNKLDAYRITLPTLSSLPNYLTEEANTDINGNMDADDLVAKYGTHFLYQGIFGGSLNYSQSISRLSVSNSFTAAAVVQANYSVFVEGKVTATFQKDTNETDEQSFGVFEAKGGTLSGLEQGSGAWAESVQEGNFTLMNFTKSSLQPISVLATDKERSEAIMTAIEKALSIPPPEITHLEWDPANNVMSAYNMAGQSGNPQKSFTTSNTNEIIVGVAATISSGKVSRMAVKLLDLRTGGTAWKDADGKSFNASNYEEMIPTSDQESKTTFTSTPNSPDQHKAFALTGLEANAKDNKVTALRGYYQEIKAAMTGAKPTFLDPDMKVLFSGYSSLKDKSPLEVSFIPDSSNATVITGVGLASNKQNFHILHLTQAPLIKVDRVAE